MHKMTWGFFGSILAIFFLLTPAGVVSANIPSILPGDYFKASNTDTEDRFGRQLAMDGDTIVVAAHFEDSRATGVNGDQTNNSRADSGAAYVFVRSGDTWVQQAYLKASNTGANDLFGTSVAVSGDTIVVGAEDEDSRSTGVDGNDNNNGASNSGAAYVFVREGATWRQQAYLKASNTDSSDQFGAAVAVSGDTIIVGAPGEDSDATGINGDEDSDTAITSGAAYVFVRSGDTWVQQAYLKASNTSSGARFGDDVAIDGDTVIVGASGDASREGAAYVFVREGDLWRQQAYLKASNTGQTDVFGVHTAVYGNRVAVGAIFEDGSATGVNSNQNDDARYAGAAYVFVREGDLWRQQAYLKASNTDAYDRFGAEVALSADTILIGATSEDSNATGVNSNQGNNSAQSAGAAYTFVISPTASVEGTVTDADAGSTPLVNVQMYLNGVPAGCTDGAGAYTIDSLIPSQSYTVSTQGEACGTSTTSYTSASRTVTAPAAGVDFALQRQASLSGVVQSDGGGAVQNIQVTISDGGSFSASACTDASGAYQVTTADDGLPRAALTVTTGGSSAGSACGNPAADIYSAQSQPADLLANSSLTVDFTLGSSLPPAGAGVITVDSIDNTGLFPSLALNAYGYPFMAYWNATTGSLWITTCTDPQCDTVIRREVDNTAAQVGRDPAVGFMEDGRPIIAYHDLTHQDLKLMRCDSFDCQTATTIIANGSGDVGSAADMVINNDVAHIAYYDATAGQVGYSTCDLAALTCSSTGLASVGGQPTPAITLNASGLPLIAYSQPATRDLQLTICNDMACSSYQDVNVSSAMQTGFFPDVTVDSGNRPVITYYQAAPDSGLYLSRCNDPSCNSATVTQVAAGFSGFFSNVALIGDVPIIAAYKTGRSGYADQQLLELFRCSDANCSNAALQILDRDGNTGRYASMVLNASDEPLVAFYLHTDGDLRLYRPEATMQCFVRNATTGLEAASPDHRAVQFVHDAATTQVGHLVQVAGICQGASDWDGNGTAETLLLDKGITLRGGYDVSSGTPDWSTSDPAQYPTLLDASASGRVIDLQSASTLTLENLTLQNGAITGANGGSIVVNSASLTLNGVVVRGSIADLGGGIFVDSGATLSLTGSLITGNHARTDGGGLYISGTTVSLTNTDITQNRAGVVNERDGGGFYAATGSAVTLVGGSIAQNTATRGGAGFYALGSETVPTTINVTDTVISANAISSTRSGSLIQGGGFVVDGVSVTLTNVDVTGNVLSSAASVAEGAGFFAANGGTIKIDDSRIQNNIVGSTAQGSGGGFLVRFVQGTNLRLTITNSRIAENRASGDGGGFVKDVSGNTSGSRVNITETTLSDNSSAQGNGGAFYATGPGRIDITRSLINGNTAQQGDGGGFYATGSIVRLSNSTLSGNSVQTGSGGGFWANNRARVRLDYVTVANNLAAADASDGFYAGSQRVRFNNSIVAFNGALTGSSGTENCAGTFRSVQNNYENSAASSGPCGFNGSSNLILGPLADNGGPTHTHALISGDAIDGAQTTTCDVRDDQRYARRPNGNACDAGAYESGSSAPAWNQVTNPMIVIMSTALAGTDVQGPVGEQISTAPVFTWRPVAGASAYTLRIDSPAGTLFNEMLPAEAICADGLCAITPPLAFADGSRYRWWVQATAPDMIGEWSAPAEFHIALVPSAPQAIAPVGLTDSAQPTFTWNGDAIADWYELVIMQAETPVYAYWYRAADVCQATACAVTPGLELADGDYTFHLRAENNGAYSVGESLPFTINGEMPPEATVEPTAEAPTETPTETPPEVTVEPTAEAPTATITPQPSATPTVPPTATVTPQPTMTATSIPATPTMPPTVMATPEPPAEKTETVQAGP